MARVGRRAFLDGPWARLVALAVIGLCILLVLTYHRQDPALLGADGPQGLGEGAEAAQADPAAACITQRFAEIDTMISDGVVGGDQAALFKQRAEAMCRATTREGAAPVPPLSGER